MVQIHYMWIGNIFATKVKCNKKKLQNISGKIGNFLWKISSTLVEPFPKISFLIVLFSGFFFYTKHWLKAGNKGCI